MRVKFLGDRADQWKWDQLRTTVNKRTLLYSGMFSDFCEDNSSPSGVTKLATETREYFFDAFERFIVSDVTRESIVHRRPYEFLVRTQYFDELRDILETHRGKKSRMDLQIFLDPNTGIEPNWGCTEDHVPLLELLSLLDGLSNKEELIIYQHQGRVANTESDFWLRKYFLERTLVPKLKSKITISLIDAPPGIPCYFILFKRDEQWNRER